MIDTMTVLVHGTFSQHDPWTLPSERESLHNFLKSNVFPDDFMIDNDDDVFIWDTGVTNERREQGIADLESYCLEWRDKLKLLMGLNISAFRLVGHSHGATVANGAVARLASHGLRVKTLIDLAVPVRFADTNGLELRCSLLRPCYLPKHKPDLAHVDGQVVYVLHATDDRIVTQVAAAQQDFSGTPLGAGNGQHLGVRTKPLGDVARHWLPTEVDCWTEEGWDQLPF